jgi:DNA-binding response OmpR family regulator
LKNCWRVRANLRRLASDAVPAFESKGFSVDFEARRVTAFGEEVHLAPGEFEVLRELMANQGKLVSHRRLLQSVGAGIRRRDRKFESSDQPTEEKERDPRSRNIF